MNEITISEREKQVLLYKMAWVRSRNFSLEHDQDVIRETFVKMFLAEAAKPTESLLLLLQRSFFVLEGEGNNRERVVLKESDYPLMAIFFSEYITYVKADYPKLEHSPEMFSRPPMDILIKGFTTLISEKVLRKFYLKKYSHEEQINFVTSIQVLLGKLLEVIDTSTSRTAIRKALRDVRLTLTVDIPNWEAQRIQLAEENRLKIEAEDGAVETVSTVAPVIARPVKKKSVSAYTKKEMQEAIDLIAESNSPLSEEEQLKVIAYIAKSSNRINDFINQSNSSFFIHSCFHNNISMEIDLGRRFYQNNKELMDNKIAELTAASVLDGKIQTYMFDIENFDWQEVAEEFLVVYENNGMAYAEELLTNHSGSLLNFNSYVASDSPFRFKAEERDFLNLLLWVSKSNKNRIIKIDNSEISIVDKDLVGKLELKITKEGYHIPSTHIDWSTYSNVSATIFELFIEKDIQLTTEQYIIAQHLLSLVQVFEIVELRSFKVLEYKIQNFSFTSSEFSEFISRIERKRREDKMTGKITFNKRFSKHLLETISGFYSELSNTNKGHIFSKIEESLLIEWLKVLDPDLLNVAQIMPNSLASNIDTLFTNMTEIKNRSSMFSIRRQPQY